MEIINSFDCSSSTLSALVARMNSTGRFSPELRKLVNASYDQCRTCNAKLQREVVALAGYDTDDRPIYVGPCCSDTVKEIASHIYWWWHADRRVDPSTPLWRYMDFAKFVALLDERALYFARADRLGDPFEGASGISERQPQWDAHYRGFFREAIISAPGRTEPPPSDEVERESARLLEEFRVMNERERTRSFVNCWHANTVESEAIWKLYCPPPASGIALRTTLERLQRSFEATDAVVVGKVHYIDFRTSFANPYDRIFSKRSSLSHEAEVRAVIQLGPYEEQPLGQSVRVELENLIEGVVPSPFSPPWFPDLVSRTLGRFGINVPILASELLSEPFV